MRAFLAIDPPGDVTEALSRVQAMLPAGRRVPQENLHLTLAFLDEQPEERLEDLHYRLEALQAPPFSLGFSGLGCFGGRSPRILFAEVAPSAPLTELHRLVTGAARRCRIGLSRERFHPHVTLARFRPGAGIAARLQAFLVEHGDIALPDFPVTGFSLFRSTLHHNGARHDRLAQYALR